MVQVNSVTSISDLRSISNPVTSPIIQVLGYATQYDGGGGTFCWNPVPPGTVPVGPGSKPNGDDDGTIIVPSAGGGYWMRDFYGAYDIGWYGAYVTTKTIIQVTTIIQNIIDYLKVTENGGEIILSGSISITKLDFYGGQPVPITPQNPYGILYITNPNNKTLVKLTGMNSCNLKTTLTSGSMINFGKTGLSPTGLGYCNFRTQFEGILFNANYQNITVINGAVFSAYDVTNVMTYFNNCTIWNFQDTSTNTNGTSAIGIDLGRMTDCRFSNITIQSWGGGIGIKTMRETCHFYNTTIMYCTHAVYVQNFVESSIKMFGGSILNCGNNITFEVGNAPGGYLSLGSYLIGTYMAEVTSTTNLVNILNPNPSLPNPVFYCPGLTLIGCTLACGASGTSHLIDLTNYNGVITFQSCSIWFLSTKTDILIGQYSSVIALGNDYKISFSGRLDNLNSTLKNPVVLNYTFKGTFSNANSFETFIIPFNVTCLIGISACTSALAPTTGNCSLQLIKNTTLLPTTSLNNIKNGVSNDYIYGNGITFAKDDKLQIAIYPVGISSDYTISLTLLVV